MGTIYKLGEYEENGYHDSDFFAVLYNTETNTVWSDMVGTTRGGAMNVPAYPAATPDILAQAAAVIAKKITDAQNDIEFQRAKIAQKGSEVIFFRGYNARKLKRYIEAGTPGTVIYHGVDERRSNNYYGVAVKFSRYGVQLEDGTTVFVSQHDAAASLSYDDGKIASDVVIMPTNPADAFIYKTPQQSTLEYALKMPVGAYRSIGATYLAAYGA